MRKRVMSLAIVASLVLVGSAATAAVVGKYRSISEHDFGAASCNAHCKMGSQMPNGQDEGDDQRIQETYSPALKLSNFSYECFPQDAGQHYCDFISYAIVTGDPDAHTITMTFRNRSGPIKIYLTADING